MKETIEERKARFDFRINELVKWFELGDQGQQVELIESIAQLADLISEDMPEIV
jgi:hypothetical protein